MSTKKYLRDFVAYVKGFCAESSFHGFNHIVAPHRHLFERLMWLFLVTLSVVGFSYIVSAAWQKYQTSAFFIASEVDYRQWSDFVPAYTIVYVDKVDENKAKDYVKSKWGEESGENYEHLLSFVKMVVNSSIRDMHKFERFANDTSLDNVDFTQIVLQVAFNEGHRINNKRSNNLVPRLVEPAVITEAGVTYCVNSPLANWIGERQKHRIIGPQNLDLAIGTKCYWSNNNCFGGLVLFSRPHESYLHSAMEIPNFMAPPRRPNWEFGTTFEVLMVQEIASPDLLTLTKEQRRCLFMDEPQHPDDGIYTSNICYTNCRRDFFVELCGCVPHFYLPRAKIPYCTAQGLVCASKHVEEILEKTIGTNKVRNCRCPRQCEATYVHTMSVATSRTKQKSRWVQWQVTEPSRSRYRREVVFLFSDLLVSWGGTAGLFLGCSILSAVEALFYFSVRLLRKFKKTSINPKKELQSRELFGWRIQRQFDYLPDNIYL